MAAGGGEEPNLTPFIDLFSVLICFLLMTAAWLQLESLQTNIEAATSKEPSDEPPPPPDPNKVNLTVALGKTSTILTEKENKKEVPKVNGEINEKAIVGILSEWKKKYPQKNDVVVNSESGVFYGELISIYDLLIQTGWPDVGINPN